MSEEKMVNKFICIFCDDRRPTYEAHITSGKIGICKQCYAKLDKTSPSLPYHGTEHISYVLSPFEYTKSMRRVILDFKFHNCYAYAPLLADMMKEYLNSYDIWQDFDYLVPVPLHKDRLSERGYNQSELIANNFAAHINTPMRTDILARTRATKRQSTLRLMDRIENVRGAFSCTAPIQNKAILLFDDIYTSGNTMEECAKTLYLAGAKKVCAIAAAIHQVKELPIITY